VAPPFRIAEVDIIYGEGISKTGTLLDMAVDRDIIHKSGAWFSYEDQRIGQGRENARQYLKDNPDVADKLDKIIRADAMAALERKDARDVEEELAEADEQLANDDPDLALLDDIE
jgi:recombination protein RecA